jgi:hypothetical protein
LRPEGSTGKMPVIFNNLSSQVSEMSKQVMSASGEVSNAMGAVAQTIAENAEFHVQYSGIPIKPRILLRNR